MAAKAVKEKDKGGKNGNKNKKTAKMLTDLDYELPKAKLLKGQKKRIRKFLMVEFAESIEAKKNLLEIFFYFLSVRKSELLKE